jgi:hypothetical protein
VRIERLWRDVRKDSLEVWRLTFAKLEDMGLLDMENSVHRVCLFLVYQPRIQASLDRTIQAWNNHKIRTAGNKTPRAIWELSREAAKQRGDWTGDPGDDIATASGAEYGLDFEAPQPPDEEAAQDPHHRSDELPDDASAEDLSSAGIQVNADEELEWARDILSPLDLQEEDNEWGMVAYCKAVAFMAETMSSGSDSDEE